MAGQIPLKAERRYLQSEELQPKWPAREDRDVLEPSKRSSQQPKYGHLWLQKAFMPKCQTHRHKTGLSSTQRVTFPFTIYGHFHYLKLMACDVLMKLNVHFVLVLVDSRASRLKYKYKHGQYPYTAHISRTVLKSCCFVTTGGLWTSVAPQLFPINYSFGCQK